MSNPRDTGQLELALMIFLHGKKIYQVQCHCQSKKTNTSLVVNSLSFCKSHNSLRSGIDLWPWPFDLELFWVFRSINIFMKERFQGFKSNAPHISASGLCHTDNSLPYLLWHGTQFLLTDFRVLVSFDWVCSILSIFRQLWIVVASFYTWFSDD